MRAFILENDTVRKTGDAEAVRQAYAAQLPLWLDLDADCKTPEVEQLLAETFQLHPLCIEDIWSDATIPKIEDFERYIYVLVNGVTWTPGSPRVELMEMDLVLGERF